MYILQAIDKFNNLNIEYIKHTQNKGLGGALTTGFHALKDIKDSDMLVAMDGDNTHNPYLIRQMIAKVDEGADIIIASRYLEQSRIYGLSKFRIFLSICAKYIYSFTWNIDGVKDYTCGFRCYRGSLVKKFIYKYQGDIIEEKGFAATGEVLKKMNYFKPLIVEVPMILKYSNKINSSSMQILNTIYKTLGMIWKR
ncbi:glycosyltransferase [Sulfurimonas gotlandica GD1]|nr:glycosyltransferase [Sulfurimonas gotlandica GD1]